MARIFLTSIDLSKNELLNAVIQNLATAPTDPVEGQVYCDTAEHNIKFYLNGLWETWVNAALLGSANGAATLNGSSLVVQNPANATSTPTASKIPIADLNGKLDNGWIKTGSGNDLDADTLDSQHGSYYLARANHTGTQTASTISDFDTQVRTSRLDQMAAPTASVSFNGQIISDVADPVNGNDATNKSYVDSVSQGLSPKTGVQAASVSNLTLSGTQTIDGVVLSVSDRVLVKNQTLPEENGVYSVQSGAWTRDLDTDTWNELISAYVFVEGGTVNTGSGWVCSVESGGTLGTTPVTWNQFSQTGNISGVSVGGGAVEIFKQKNGSNLEFRTINDTTTVNVTQTGDLVTFDVIPEGLDINDLGGSALEVAKGGTGGTTAAEAKTNLGFTSKYAASIGNGSATSFSVTHNLGSEDVVVQVRMVGSPKSVVEPDISIIDSNSVSIGFNVAPTLNQYRVIVIG